MDAGIKESLRYVKLNGQKLQFWRGPHGERRAKEYAGEVKAVPHTDLYLNLTSLSLGTLVEAAGLVGAYDFAVPQNFFDRHLQEKGERPVGVWWYPKRSDPQDGAYWLAGRFVDLSELIERIGRRIAAGEGSEW